MVFKEAAEKKISQGFLTLGGIIMDGKMGFERELLPPPENEPKLGHEVFYELLIELSHSYAPQDSNYC